MKTPFPSIEPLESRIAPATLVVTSLADHGPGTLRAALATAGMTPASLTTIIFKLPAAPAHSENTIDLTTGTLGCFGNVKIIGPGAGKLIIDAQGNSQVFSISDNGISGRGTAVDSPASISGLSIVGGHVANGKGAGIYCTESLTLKNVVISGNTTTGSASGDSGGGLYVNGTDTLTRVSITNCLITGNSTQAQGGGMFIKSAKSVTLVKSVLSDNSAVGPGTAGGGAYITTPSAPGVLTITGCTIAGNTLGPNGVAGGLGIEEGGSTTISATKITGNGGGFAGGGLLIGGRAGKTLITGSLISANTALYFGAGLGFSASGSIAPGTTPVSLTISRSTISGNQTTLSNLIYPGGAGIYIKGTDSGTEANLPVTISSSVISSNICEHAGGGILMTKGVAATLSACTISGNTAIDGATMPASVVVGGGGIAAYGTSGQSVYLTVKGGTISGNSASSPLALGGGILTEGTGTLSVTSTHVTGNAAESGGGISADIFVPSSTPTVMLKNVTAANNVALQAGGAFASELIGGSFSITGGSMKGNMATKGGAIATVAGGGSVTGAIISGNIATGKGGGLYASSLVTAADLTVQIAKVTGNTAPFGPDVSGPMTYV